jgi:hypothetical protein
MDSAALAEALLQAVRGMHFEDTLDPWNQGRPLSHFPSLDLAVIGFARDGREPIAANVLFSREHPQGHAAAIAPGFGTLQGIRFDADQRNAAGDSVAWLPQSDWQALQWQPLWGSGPLRFVAPYPASLLKLMVAVGMGMAVDRGAAAWSEPLPSGRSVEQALWEMISFSSNEATDDGVALMHRAGVVQQLHDAFTARGLHSLQLRNTTPAGGWRNGDGAGVGQIHMTAWDTARLLWLLDPDAPPAAWLPADLAQTPLLSAASHAQLWQALADQGLHEVLSSTSLAGVPGCVPGIPAQMPARWLAADGSAAVGGEYYPPGIAAASSQAQVAFWHKTGTTDNYASDAGVVRGLGDRRRHYIVALLSSLGQRYAPQPVCATCWKLPALGAAVDALMRQALER